MKKMKLFSLGILAILLAAAFYIVYELKWKDYDIADKNIEDLIQKDIEIQLPNGEKITLGEHNNISEDGEQDINTIERKNSIDYTDSPATGGGMTSKESNPVEAPSAKKNSLSKTQNETADANMDKNEKVDSIMGKYDATFIQLENEAKTRLNELIKLAKNEYSTKKVNGEKISYGYFYRKYSNAAAELEESIDVYVDYVSNLVKLDLENNGFDSSHAENFIKKYEESKEALRNELLRKTISF